MILPHTNATGDLPRRHNHITRLAWLPQLFQYLEAVATDAQHERLSSTGHKKRRGLLYRDQGDLTKTPNTQLWESHLGGKKCRHSATIKGGEYHFMLALGRSVDRAKKAGVILAIEKPALLTFLKKYEDPHSIHTTRAHLFKQIPRVISALLAMALHDQRLFGQQGYIALVGLKLDGSRRHYNRLKSYMGKHLCSPALSARLEDILELLTHTRIILDGEDCGIILRMDSTPRYVTGDQLNQNAPTCVRGGRWQMGIFNEKLFSVAFKHFMQVDVRAYQLRDQDFNVYLNTKSDHHMQYGKKTGKERQRVLFSAQELTRRAGLVQLTQKTTWQERRCLLRALKRMKRLGLIEDYGEQKPYRGKDLWVSFPPD